ncbi:acetate--CoA ligase family protein [Desulfoferrobacter suflitae]|uniref:acetate--CoA ligase family protein n=1 Tax=Desulfoferrobacter suflitae TaxID=2865782 RepID=UPI00216428EE|nr:acetate--CoA ligase [Desulfoferrobacter suflitae]MCK8601177.1 acetate--CoA ligase family protein [Desulfoferrobacter suflitae]
MHKLFSPQSVVVIGVSESEDNLGRNILSNLVRFGYQGKIYAVGPRGGQVLGIPILQSVDDLAEPVELAVLLTPARFIPDILAQCGAKGIRRAVVESGGFRELGPHGQTLEDQLLEISARFGLSFVGPNCIGVIHTKTGIYTPFIALPKPYKQGRASVFAQSGGVGLTLGERLSSSGIGVNKLVSMGNKLSLDETDFLQFLVDDPDTQIIFFYLEDFKRGRQFAEAARGSAKPILLLKSNTSPLSQAIAQSHTAALAGDDQVVDAVCKEVGVMRVRSVAEVINAMRGFSMPPLQGGNLAVVSRSGGHAVVAADACARRGFHLPPLREELLEAVRRKLRAGVIRLGNPMDLGDLYDMPFNFDVVKSVLRQEDIHGVIFIHVTHMTVEREASRKLLQDLWELSWQYGKPVAMVVEIPFEERVFLLQTADFPFFSEPGEAVEALWCQWQQAKHAARRTGPPPSAPSPSWREQTVAWLSGLKSKNRQPLLHEALELMDRIDIPTAPWKMVTDLSSAREAARTMGFPVALKAVAPSLLHKSEKSAIALNIAGDGELDRHWSRLNALAGDVEGVVVQKMVFASRELIIGAKRDPSFGPLVLVGFGGIVVEVLKDVSMRLAPIGAEAAMQMLRELSGARILEAFRGMHQADLDGAARILVTISQLMHQVPFLSELDLNPVSLDDAGKGAVALDARLLFTPGEISRA